MSREGILLQGMTDPGTNKTHCNKCSNSDLVTINLVIGLADGIRAPTNKTPSQRMFPPQCVQRYRAPQTSRAKTPRKVNVFGANLALRCRRLPVLLQYQVRTLA